MNLNKLHNDIHEGALQLMAEHRVQLFAKAKTLCDSDDEAEELVIRTIDKAIRKINTYAGEGDILSWMTTILVNLHADEHRSRVVRSTTAVEAAQLEQYAGADTRTEEQILANSDHDALREAIRQLEPEYRRMVALYYFNELSLREVAEFLNTSTSSVSRKLELARKILCSKLETKLGKRSLAILATVLFGVSALFGAYQAGIVHANKPAEEAPVVASAPDQFQEIPQEQESLQEPPEPPQEEDTEMNQSEIAVTTAATTGSEAVRKANTDDGTLAIVRTKSSQRRSGAVKQAVLSASILAAATGLAGSITWTGGAGDTDLFKPGNWGVETLSGADNATINVNNQTFTLEKNTSFSTMALGSNAKAVTFDFSANPTNEVYLGAASGDGFAPSAPGVVLSFKGGVWRGGAGNKANFSTAVGGNDSTTVLDGTIVTNFTTLAFGYKSPSQQLTELKNGAQVHVTKAENGNGAGSNTVLKVSSGSKLIASGTVRVSNRIGGAAEGKGFHKLIVEGEGSLLKTGTGEAQSGLRIGDTYMGCSVIVTNRATLYAKGLYFSSHHNNLWMSNATVSLLGSFLNLDGATNRLDLLDCDDVSIDRLCVCGSYGRCCIRGNQGRITLPTFVNPGGSSWGSANEVEIWDTVSAANYGGYGSPVGRGNVYRLMRSAVVNTGAAGALYVTASQRELNFCGEGTTGGVVRCNEAMTFASAQTNCYLRLMDGVRYENLTTDFYFGYRKSNGINDKGIDSTIYIGTNSTMSLLNLYVGNTGHRVVIDSGTLETPELKLDADNRVGGTQTNSVVFSGTHPKFLYTPSAAYSLPTTSGWYVFEIPPEGYEAAPLQVSKDLKIPDGAQVVVHADIEKLSRHFSGQGGLVPLMAGTSVTVSDAKLAAMKDALGQRRARFVVKDNTLYLRVSGAGGMVLVR